MNSKTKIEAFDEFGFILWYYAPRAYSEFLDDSMVGLSKLLDFKFQMRRSNVGKVKPPKSETTGVSNINVVAKNLFKERNSKDYELYRLCKKLFLNSESIIKQ